MVNKAINAATEIVGSQQELTDAYGVKQPSIRAWLHEKKKVSAENAKYIKLATEKNVPTYQIHPDLSDLLPHSDQAT